MSRDQLVEYLSSCAAQGIRVPQEAFDLASTIDLNRVAHLPMRDAALLVLRMGLQAHFRFLTVRPSLLDTPAARGAAGSAHEVAGGV